VDRRAFLATLTGGLLAAPLAAEAQPARKVYRVGYLGLGARRDALAESLLRALHDLGYIEGQNLVMEFRWAAGNAARLPDLADELARARVDVIMAFSTQGVRAAKRATETIPIVFVAGNPVMNGVVASLAHPGGNATGVALQVIGAVKASQLLKEAVPKVSRIAYLYDPRSTPPEQMKALEDNVDLKLLRVTVRPIPFSDTVDSDGIAKKIGTATDGLILQNSPSLQLAAQQLCTLARQRRLPTIGTRLLFAEDGCLIAYGEDEFDWTRQMASIVHKILMGAKPADVPVEQPTKVKLKINLKTAKALGLTIPPSLLQRADQVIE
jgi:putative ABC transport system substrate-binding protein